MDISKFRVYLRVFEFDDYLTTHAWRKDDELWYLHGGRKYFVSSEYEKKWINNAIFNNQNNIRLATCLKDTDELIGIIHLI